MIFFPNKLIFFKFSQNPNIIIQNCSDTQSQAQVHNLTFDRLHTKCFTKNLNPLLFLLKPISGKNMSALLPETCRKIITPEYLRSAAKQSIKCHVISVRLRCAIEKFLQGILLKFLSFLKKNSGFNVCFSIQLIRARNGAYEE